MFQWVSRSLEKRRDKQAATRIVTWAHGRKLAPISIEPRKPKTVGHIPLTLGNVTIDLQPKPTETMHVAVGGTSRQGKSTSVLGLLDLPIGVLIISLDNTRPIAMRIRDIPDGVEWSNEEDWPVRWNMLSGSPRLVAESLTAGWPRSDHESGHYRDIARLRMASRLAQADRDGEVRSLVMLIEALMQPTHSPDPMIDRACRHWATKVANMYDVLGSSIGGPGDLDLLQAMLGCKKVLMRLNRYLNPEVAPMLGGMLLVHARRVAQESTLPFILIVEEAGQMDEHDEQIKPLAQAAADRGVPTVILTQNLSKLPVEVANNISTWVSFSQEAKSELAFAAHHLRLDPLQLRREAFPGKDEQQGRGWCYVRAPGMVTHLVHVEDAKTTKKEQKEIERVISSRPAARYEIDELPALDGWRQWTPALPPASPPTKEGPPAWVGFDKDMLRFWKQMRRTDRATPLWSPERGVWWDERGCLEWHGPLSKPKGAVDLGRPRSNIGKRSVTVYIETKMSWARMMSLDERTAVEPCLDHNCDNPICCDPEHTSPTSIASNNANRPVREVMLHKAWMDRCNFVPGWWTNRHTQRVGV